MNPQQITQLEKVISDLRESREMFDALSNEYMQLSDLFYRFRNLDRYIIEMNLEVAGKLTLVLSLVANGGITIKDAQNIILGTTTGTKIGTSASEKLGFFGKTPVVQVAGISSPTAPSATYVQAEAQSAKNAIDALRVALSNLGLTA